MLIFRTQDWICKKSAWHWHVLDMEMLITVFGTVSWREGPDGPDTDRLVGRNQFRAAVEKHHVFTSAVPNSTMYRRQLQLSSTMYRCQLQPSSGWAAPCIYPSCSWATPCIYTSCGWAAPCIFASCGRACVYFASPLVTSSFSRHQTAYSPSVVESPAPAMLPAPTVTRVWYKVTDYAADIRGTAGISVGGTWAMAESQSVYKAWIIILDR